MSAIGRDIGPQTESAFSQSERSVQERPGNGPPSIPGERGFQVAMVKNKNAPDLSDKSNKELKEIVADPPGNAHGREANEHREAAINELYARGEIDYFVDYDASDNTFQVYDSSGEAVGGPVSSYHFLDFFSNITGILFTSFISDIVSDSFEHIMSKSRKDDKDNEKEERQKIS